MHVYSIEDKKIKEENQSSFLPLSNVVPVSLLVSFRAAWRKVATIPRTRTCSKKKKKKTTTTTTTTTRCCAARSLAYACAQCEQTCGCAARVFLRVRARVSPSPTSTPCLISLQLYPRISCTYVYIYIYTTTTVKLLVCIYVASCRLIRGSRRVSTSLPLSLYASPHWLQHTCTLERVCVVCACVYECTCVYVCV